MAAGASSIGVKKAADTDSDTDTCSLLALLAGVKHGKLVPCCEAASAARARCGHCTKCGDSPSLCLNAEFCGVG
jgi:hypothetical protein